jgi:ribosomal-protein-alanine N-acetyltransferase
MPDNNVLYTLRKASAEDLDSLYALECREMLSPWTKNMVFESIKNDDFFLLSEKNRLLGFAVFTNTVEEGELLQILVDSNCRRQGIGSYLLKKGLEHMKENHAVCCFLEVRASNIGAIALYNKIGFLEIGRRKNYYRTPDGREDALIMRIDLHAQ